MNPTTCGSLSSKRYWRRTEVRIVRDEETGLRSDRGLGPVFTPAWYSQSLLQDHMYRAMAYHVFTL